MGQMEVKAQATSESRAQLSVRKSSLLGRGKACLGACTLSIPRGGGVERRGEQGLQGIYHGRWRRDLSPRKGLV